MCFWYRSQARRSWHLYQSSFDGGKMLLTDQGKAERNYYKKLLCHGRLATKFLRSGPWDAESLSFRATGDRYGRAVRLQIVNSSTRRVKQERVLLSLRKVKEMPWRQWPRCGLGWLCILLVICCSVTVVSSYCVALSYGHIYPFLPAISETGVLFPEKYVFRELANLSAFLFISNAFVRFMQYKLVAEQYPEDNVKLHRLNKLAFAVAILAGLGMTLVANFEIEKVCSKLKFAVLYSVKKPTKVNGTMSATLRGWGRGFTSESWTLYDVTAPECLFGWRSQMTSLYKVSNPNANGTMCLAQGVGEGFHFRV